MAVNSAQGYGSLPLDLPTWKRIVTNVDTRIADQRSKPQKLELTDTAIFCSRKYIDTVIRKPRSLPWHSMAMAVRGGRSQTGPSAAARLVPDVPWTPPA